MTLLELDEEQRRAFEHLLQTEPYRKVIAMNIATFEWREARKVRARGKGFARSHAVFFMAFGRPPVILEP